MAGPRRRAREIALQILVQMDVNPELAADAAVRLYFDHLAGAGDDDADDADADDAAPRGAAAFDRQLVGELVQGVAARRADIDAGLQELSRNWRVERMALVERNVIRIALYELKLAAAPVPVNVAINEAIELTKRYGTAEGAAFVNGLLDRAVSELVLRR